MGGAADMAYTKRDREEYLRRLDEIEHDKSLTTLGKRNGINDVRYDNWLKICDGDRHKALWEYSKDTFDLFFKLFHLLFWPVVIYLVAALIYQFVTS